VVPLAVAAVAVWTMINPRVFAPPQSIDNCPSRCVLGEALWSAREEVPIPEGVPFGLAVHMLGKLWFLDRMALLYDEMTT
jgi:hypothetical protein